MVGGAAGGRGAGGGVTACSATIEAIPVSETGTVPVMVAWPAVVDSMAGGSAAGGAASADGRPSPHPSAATTVMTIDTTVITLIALRVRPGCRSAHPGGNDDGQPGAAGGTGPRPQLRPARLPSHSEPAADPIITLLR
jgi:hypothetical protein